MKIELEKEVTVSRFISGKRESGRIVITDPVLFPLVSDEKRKCKIIFEDIAEGTT